MNLMRYATCLSGAYRVKSSRFGSEKIILYAVPFAKYLIWKHKLAKAANLCVKLYFFISAFK